MSLQKNMKITCILLLCISGLSYANDAVNSASGQFVGSTSRENGTYRSDSVNERVENTNYNLSGSLTLPVEGFKYLGVSLGANGSYDRNRLTGSWGPMVLDDKTRTDVWEGYLHTFLRDSNFAGVLFGYAASHKQEKGRYTSSIEDVTRYSYSENTKSRYIVGQYYFEDFTVSAKLSKTNSELAYTWCCDSISRTGELTWYPKNNLSLYASLAKERYFISSSAKDFNSNSSFDRYSYVIGGEFQPEYFNSKLKLTFSRNWTSSDLLYDDLKVNTVAANYYYHDFSLLNSTPSLGLSFIHRTNPAWADDDNYIMFQLGLLFDNRINIKDRDRKYLFSTGYQ
jgi:hypothetical protein